MGVYLAPFDPSRNFVAIRFFRHNGVIYSRRDPFPSADIDERKLRQLYETRNIGYAEDQQTRSFPPASPPPAEPEPPEDRETVINRLVNRYNRPKLLKLAKGLELADDATKAVIAAALVDAGRVGDNGTA